MQRIPQAIAAAQLTNAVATYYTTPTNVIATISALTLTNTTAGSVTATVHIVPDGGSASDSNKVLHAKAIAAGESYVVSPAIAQSMEAGATLQALAGANTSITLVGSVYETTI